MEGKNWSMYDIDRLLSRTEKSAKSEDSTVVESYARTMRLADAVPADEKTAEENSRVETAEQPVEYAGEAKTVRFDSVTDYSAGQGDVSVSTRTAKQRVSDVVKGMKGSQQARQGDNRQEQTSVFDEPLLPKKEYSMETDENRRRFLEVVNLADEEETFDETKVIERPGFVVKRGKIDEEEGLEEAPKIVDADTARIDKELFAEKLEEAENWADGQMKFSGFENQDETPEKITEAEAEAKVRKNRRDKINKFKLMGIAEAEEDEEEKEQDKTIEKLFNAQQPVKKQSKSKRVNRAGVEYTDPKDANRIRGTLNRLKGFSFLKFAGFSAIAAVALLLNIVACASAGHETTLIQIANFILLIVCLVLGVDTINSGVVSLLKRETDMKSSIAVASLAVLVQNICMILGGVVINYHSFMLTGCIAAAFALDEYGDYLRHSRTFDAFNFCTGRFKRKLYSIQEIENKNEKFEIGRNLLMDSPDIRYSCRAKFPSRLIEQCEGDVSADKMQSLLLPIILIGSAVCGLLAAIVAGDFLYGVTVWAGAVCVCIPAFGVASIQLPLKWANKRLNKSGGLITGQRAIEEYSKSNSIVLDSADLFDRKNCRMHGFKDFKNVRVDDIMLYAAAMVVRSGGPLSDAFDQVVSKRELLPEVRSFSYEDRMGISGWIDGQKVIMGNRNMMRHHNLEIVDEIDESKYTHDGRKVIYLAIANSLAAMLVVSYAPNKKLTSFIKRLGSDGVTILLRNNDANITTDMINETFGAKFDNIRLMNNTAGRIYKKYRTRVREFAKSGIIHDGAAFSFMRSFTMSYTLCGTFKMENLVLLINVIAGIVVTGVLAVLKVYSAMGMWPFLVFQAIMAAVSFIIARLRGVF